MGLITTVLSFLIVIPLFIAQFTLVLDLSSDYLVGFTLPRVLYVEKSFSL